MEPILRREVLPPCKAPTEARPRAVPDDDCAAIAADMQLRAAMRRSTWTIVFYAAAASAIAQLAERWLS